jgi:hypothetical protein
MLGQLSTGSSQYILATLYLLLKAPDIMLYLNTLALPPSGLGRPDTSGFPGSQSSILRNDSITTDDSSKGHTEANTDDRIDLSSPNFLYPGIRDSHLLPLARSSWLDLHVNALADYGIPVVSEAAMDYGPTLADAIDELTLSDPDLLKPAPATQGWTATPP